jgi:hypothetical protein
MIFFLSGLLNNMVQNLWNLFSYQFLWNYEGTSHKKPIVNNKGNEKIKSINLVNVFAPSSVDNVNIIAKPQ